jgi:hypothetical protein
MAIVRRGVEEVIRRAREGGCTRTRMDPGEWITILMKDTGLSILKRNDLFL